MDSVTHACLGMLCAVAVSRRDHARSAAVAGLVAGNLPDLDVLIRSQTDPLMSLEYHRHFTHSLVFSPVIMLLGATVGWLWGRLWSLASSGRAVPLGALLLPSLLACWSHLFCDVWTSYGTRLWWPFAQTRISLDLISVIDPIMTLPLLICALLALFRMSAKWAVRGLGWAGVYLLLCAVQQGRATTALSELLAKRGHQASRLTVKPSFGNILLWRSIYEADGHYYVDAIRPGWWGNVQILKGAETPVLEGPASADAPWQGLPAGSTALEDVRRFYHFSDRWVVWIPNAKAQKPADQRMLGDLRYAQIPNEVAPLWGISYLVNDPQKHAQTESFRQMSAAPWQKLWAMILGRLLPHAGEPGA